jgi:hypothetical protein
MKKKLFSLFVLLVLLSSAFAANSEGIGRIKTLSGQVTIERSGTTHPAELGGTVFKGDIIRAGKDGAVGLLFDDDSRIAVGPNSSLVLDNFVFDQKTNEGNFDVSLKKGTLSAIAGKLTAKTPGAMKVRTPAAILAVRGTEFSAKVDDPK